MTIPRQVAARARAGSTLPLALVALALIGALAAGAALAVTRDARAGTDALLTPRAMDAADAVIAHAAWRAWDKTRNLGALGGVLATDTLAGPGGALGVVRATRVDSATIWFAAEGTAPTAMPGVVARRRVSMLARLAVPDVVLAATMTARAQLSVSGPALISGTDSTHAAWSGVCPPSAGGIAGAATASPALVCDGACGAPPTRIVGAPPILTDSMAGDSARYLSFGGESWQSLVSRADITLGGGAYRPRPSVVGAACDATDPLDWGDPSRGGACADRFPIIHIVGDFTAIAGGTGQGILLVDGDVIIGGGFTFTGLIIAGDDIVASGVGNVITGAVLAADRRGNAADHSAIGGDTRLIWSRCAVDRARAGSASLRPARERAWASLF